MVIPALGGSGVWGIEQQLWVCYLQHPPKCASEGGSFLEEIKRLSWAMKNGVGGGEADCGHEKIIDL